MTTRRICWLLFIAILIGGRVCADELPDTVAKVKRGVFGVGIVALPKKNKPTLIASGFAVSGGTYGITTLSTIEARSGIGSKEAVGVFLPVSGTQAQFRQAAVISRDEEHDLCLLRFPGPALPALRLGRTDDAREGGLYAFTGFPSTGTVGLHAVTHRALIAAISPNILPVASGAKLGRDVLKKLNRPYDVFQLDATPFKGNEGSPLYEVSTGRVVGVINSLFVKKTKEMASSNRSGISYAIPVTHVRSLLSRAGLGY
jgi:serine protease Do